VYYGPQTAKIGPKSGPTQHCALPHRQAFW